MDDPEGRPFGGFGFAIRTFYVKASDLKVSRGCSRDPYTADDKSLGPLLEIRGIAVGEKDDVCVIGTTERSRVFDLSVRSDSKAKEKWAWIKANETRGFATAEAGDTPERHIRNHQHELFEESPPTATLFVSYDDRETGIKGGWSFECAIPDIVLEQLVSDVIGHRVGTLRIGVEWVAGLVQDEYGWPSCDTTWGMFKAPDGLPEPLLGHVSRFNWMIDTDGAPGVAPEPRKFDQVCEAWMRSFEATSNEKGELWMGRSTAALAVEAKNIADWCDKNAESVENVSWRLDQAKSFVQRLDDALHQNNGPFANDKYSLWTHRNLGELYRTTKAGQREDFIDQSALVDLMTEYIRNPWLHSPYLDWLMLDAMTSAKIVASVEACMVLRHGVAYALFEGVSWKIFLWKLIMRPFGFIVNWIVPAVGCYFIARWSIWAAIGIGAVYYAFNLWLLLRRLGANVVDLLYRRPTPLRRASDLVAAMEGFYGLLTGSVMHVGAVRAAFERTAEQGVTWDQGAYYILDNLARRAPEVWDARPIGGFGEW